jgi:arylsulfatase A-like enzyme
MRNLVVVLGLFFSVIQAVNAQEQPSIIYILADDMGPGDVMAYNKKGKILTPNIDRLANEGVKFMDAHTNSSVCTPTRYGILTGRYAWRTKMKQGVLGGTSPHLISTSRETVASLLKKQGYKTACIGKWHLGMDWQLDPTKSKEKGAKKYDMYAPIKNGPLQYGFDYFFGHSGSLNMAPHAFIDQDKVQGTLEFLSTEEEVVARGFTLPSNSGWAAKEFEQEKSLSILAKKTCDWIEANSKTPFFVYVPLPSPHSPIVPSKAFQGKSKLNKHGDFCMETDWVVGQILKTLDTLNLSDNTLVVFTSDNGTSPKAGFSEMQKQGHYPSWIYRGLKGSLLEGGHRMPFLARWPNKIKGGLVNYDPICTTDLLATCAEIVNVKVSDNVGEDSFSFLPAFKEKELNNKNRLLVHHSDKGFFALREGKWKLMLHPKAGTNRRNPKEKLNPIKNQADEMLFNMEIDVEESTNVANKHPEIVEILKKHLAEIIESGRSTPGKNQPTDLNSPSLKWKQLEVVKEYLN